MQRLSQDLNLSLDGEMSTQSISVKKANPVHTLPKKLTPAKFEAWRMWFEDGHSIEKIAVYFCVLMLSPFLIIAYFYCNVSWSSLVKIRLLFYLAMAPYHISFST